MEHFGAWSLLPAAVVIATALITRRTLEPLLLGSVIGFIILKGPGIGTFMTDSWFTEWINAVYAVMMDGVTVWIILVCGLFGSLVALLERAGGTMGFSEIAAGVAKGRKGTLVTTWILGIIVFVDDYLNALAVGTAMRNATDKYSVSREFLAYIVNSTGATVCVLIPFSTWSAFMAGQLESSGAAEAGMGTEAYFATLPYILYAWIAVIIVPLFILKVIPLWGPMRKAEARAAAGQTLPDSTAEVYGKKDEEVAAVKGKAMNFIIPMLVLAGVVILTKDMLYGVIAGLVVCAILFAPQRLMKPAEFFDLIVSGFKDMILVLGIIVSAFILQAANDALGLTPYVIESVEPILSPSVLPMLTFIIVGLLAFTTGSFWGVAAIAFPIIVPLADSMGVSMLLVSGAVISAASLGSHTCFYGDAVTLTSASCQIRNNDYAKNVLPIIALPFLLGCIAFLVAGMIL